jgi:hypothetical protein
VVSDLQRRYQPNMLYGNLIVAALAVIFAVCLKFQEVDRVTVFITPRTLSDLIQHEQVREGGGGGNGNTPGFHGGFINKLMITPDVSVAATQFTVPAHVAFSADLVSVILDSGPALGEGSGFGNGPDDGDYGLPKAPAAFTWSLAGSGNYAIPERTITPPKPDQKAELRNFANPKLPRKSRGVRGLVKVQFTITERGNLQGMTVLEEDPKGLGLSQALIQRLNDCCVFPCVKGGAKVPTIITFTYTYGSIGAQALSVTGNVSLIMR